MNRSLADALAWFQGKSLRVGASPPVTKTASLCSVRIYINKKFRKNIFLALEKSPPLWFASGDFQKAVTQTLVAIGLRKKRKSPAGFLTLIEYGEERQKDRQSEESLC
jgi:hypothetical protein